jgi:hypothetical protein
LISSQKDGAIHGKKNGILKINIYCLNNKKVKQYKNRKNKIRKFIQKIDCMNYKKNYFK